MMDVNNPEFEFRTFDQVQAYSKFFLATNPLDISSELTPEEQVELELRREVSLNAQLNHFKDIDFSGANNSRIDGTFYKICKNCYTKPLSSEGSFVASTRFNFKNNSFFRNRTIYLGRTRQACEVELFHLEHQRENLRKKHGAIPYTPHPDDVIVPDYTVYEYNVSLDNVLILTSKPCADAISIVLSTIQDEWYDLNSEYDIPSASQILGTLARVKGYKGILYKSVRNQLESNLVIFEENSGELLYTPAQTAPYTPSPEILKVDNLLH